MTEASETADLVAGLEQLLLAGGLTKASGDTCRRLLGRLRSDISVVLAGPHVRAKEYLHDMLLASDLRGTSLRIAPWQEALDFDQIDVCVWCTVEFGNDEALQWRDAPDRLKDHSFLVVSPDPASSAPRERATKKRLDDIALEEFSGLSRMAPGENGNGLPSAPTAALVAEITNVVRIGTAADADNAQLFLKKHRSRSGAPEVSSSAAPMLRAPAPLAVIAREAQKEPPAERDVATALYRTALVTMRGHLEELRPLLDVRDDAEVSQVMSVCETTSAAVADVLSASDFVDSDLDRFREDAYSAADKILLMSREGGLEPAVAAVTTVLQLRREMELRIA